MPMMSVGVPSMPDANQVTTKPRQMPSGGGGGMGAPGENPFDEDGEFDPDSNGSNIEQEREQNDDPTDDLDSQDDGTAPESAAPPAAPPAAAPKPPQPVVARMLAIADDAMATNPGLNPRKAMVLASRVVVAYDYDPGMHNSDFSTGPSLFTRYLNDMGRKPPKQKPDTNPDPRPTSDRAPQGAPQSPNRDPNPNRPNRAEDFLTKELPGHVKDLGQSAFEKTRDLLKNRLGPRAPVPQPGPAGQGDPLPPFQSEPPKPAQPGTMGEWARQQMKDFPEVAGDYWKHRHDPRPYKPEGYWEEDEQNHA